MTQWTKGYPRIVLRHWWRASDGDEPIIVKTVIQLSSDGPVVSYSVEGNLGGTMVVGGEWWPIPITPPAEEQKS
jgi:hypothetical protein